MYASKFLHFSYYFQDLMYNFHRLKQVQLPQHTKKKECRSATQWLTRVLDGAEERKEANDFNFFHEKL